MLGIDLVMAVFAGIRTYISRARNGAGHVGGSFCGPLALILRSRILRGHIGGGLRGSFIAIASEKQCQNDRERTQQQKGNSAEKLGDAHESLPGELGFRSVTRLTGSRSELA